eukprot:TRINITY_DN16611_c0_g1_i1.p1 TRINITY_DN16611_c0_g1~~TRINITY_DN16611_c0_g1_i1.p1  ORF type:complete len:315 (+),score=45.25 TRINITY_DN16611_c0_g1_i1:222-1166(+)
MQHELHAALCKKIITGVNRFESLDSNRMTLLYFATAGVVSNVGTDGLPGDLKNEIIEWVYEQQQSAGVGGGFRSTDTLKGEGEGHVTMTQCALLVLLCCGDDLSRVDKEAVKIHLKSLQLASGGFNCTTYGESDVRFAYSACIVASVLDIWDAIDKDQAIQYVKSCMRYDGGFGANPGCEGHGGTTYCALAALYLMDAFNPSELRTTKKWLVSRLTPTGFNGRPNKDADTCYTHWIGSALSLFPPPTPIDTASLTAFVCSCQKPTGGISKTPQQSLDLLHTALPTLGLLNLKAIEGVELHRALGVPMECVRGGA